MAKTCIKCGKLFSYRSNTRFCSLECSGCPSKNRRHGLTETREHVIWRAMRWRCNNPKNTRYGARGIKVCERWDVFENFMEDMGLRPPGGTVERIDNDKGYEPGNCKWASRAEQNRNKKNLWKQEQIETMRNLLDTGFSFREVAMKLGKTHAAVSAKASKSGIRSRCKPYGSQNVTHQ